MASLCRRQKCTIERRGFRQELDSWRHKLIHCVDFESIVRSLLDPGLADDLTLFKDCEPEDVSDWSFDESCLFCCLRREKVKEHLIGINGQFFEGGVQGLCSLEQSKISRLEKQAEDFLNAVFCKKEIPSFSDPQIPSVAREIMQRMIRQFASEYTSKSSSSQDFLQPSARKDQSLSKALPRELAGPVPTASAQNPVLSKMLMAEQDFPLDLTVKKPEVEPCEQDGVLDLSIKKGHSTGSLSHRNSQGYPGTAKKSVSLERNLAKVQDMQSTSTLEQFMAKLCLHHQRQIVNALGFLQSEVKAVGSSCCAGSSASKATLEAASERDCSPVTWQENADSPSGHTAAAVSTCSARSVSQSLEMANLENGNSSLIQQLTPVHAGYTDTSCESCTSLTLANPVDLCKGTSGNSQGPSFQFSSSKESESLRPDELLLARKSPSSGSLADMDKFQLFDSSCHTSGTLDERQCNPETLLYPVRDETNLEELSLSIGSHGQLFDHLYHTEQRASSGITKDLLTCSFPVKKATKTISPSSPRTARKSSRGTYPRPRHSVCQINDADSHCDIVYISKPITECELQPPNHIFPRRNARKSTRGYAYMEEVRELKTVRTLAGKPGSNTNKGNCPALGLETSTSLTPKQALSKPESVPPVDIPFAGGCVETFGQKATLEQHIEKSMAECEVAAGREAELIVETSQTDQPPFKDQNQFPSVLSSPENQPSVLSSSENQQSTVMETKAVQQNSAAEDIVTGHDDPTELLVTQTLLPPDNLPGHDVGTGDKIASEDETENCSCDVQVLQADLRSASPISAAEEPISSESIVASSDLSKQDHVPEPPAAEDQELPVHVEKETLMQIEEHVEKENIEALQNTIIEPDSSTTDSIIPGESRTDEVGEIVEKEVMKELSMEVQQLKPTKDEVGEKEVVVTPSETVSPKRSSSRDIAPSDRCLRRRPLPVSSEPIKAIKTSLVTPNPIQIQDSPVDSLKMSGSVRPQRSIRAKQHTTLNLSDSILQGSDEMTIDKTPLSSEVRPNTNQEVDNMVQTRHKSMLAKQLENEERGQGFKPSSAAAAGPSTEVVGQKISDQVAHLKEKPAKSTSECNIPENSSMNVENTSEMCNKMPLTRERSKGDRFPKPMKSATLMKHKKLVLRSQRSAALAASSAKVENEQIQASPDTKLRTEKFLPSRTQKKDLDPFGLQKLNISMPNPPKFLEALRGEENQPQIMSLNTKFEKMQRGWVQLDKEGQPIQRPKNRADRLKEIWKSKRRVRKSKPLDQQKYSPVQMLFMKTFDLTSICHWFLQTTETKSLVIVKKVNTRLPSETALCFHSSSASSGSGNGVFSSLQAERLKKHLKKFAVASPVKSNAKNQKLIAKALEQEFPCSKGKDKVRELTSATRISTKPYSNPRKLEVQGPEPRKAVSTIKSPASARILRKYTSIREKLHVQQHALKPKEIVGEDVESSCSTALLAPKLISKPKALPEHGRKTVPAGDNGGKELHSGKTLKVNPLSSKRDSLKKAVKEKATKPNSRETLQTACKKGQKAPKRSPPASLAASKPRKPASSALSGLERRAGVPCRASNILSERKDGIVKSALPEARNSKLDMKSALRSKVLVSETVQPQKPDMLPSPAQDQVLTRSQRRMETVPSKGAVLRPSLKRSQEPLPTPSKRTRTLVLK